MDDQLRVGDAVVAYSGDQQIGQTDWSRCDIVIEATGPGIFRIPIPAEEIDKEVERFRAARQEARRNQATGKDEGGDGDEKKDDKDLKEPSRRGVDSTVLSILRGEVLAKFTCNPARLLDLPKGIAPGWRMTSLPFL